MNNNNQTKLNHKNLGLSLVEVLVAIFIIAIGVVLFGYFAKSLQTTSDARLETEAMITIRSTLENTRALWSDSQGFNKGELPGSTPYRIKAPNGYNSLTVYVDTVGTSAGDHSYSCTFDYNASAKEFENNCGILNPEDSDSLIRHVEFELSGDQREPLKLSMQISRPVE